MKLRGIHYYVGAITVVACTLLISQDWGILRLLDSSEVVGLLALAMLGVASEAVAIRLRFHRSATQASLTFIPVLATVLLFGPSLGMALAAVIMFVSQFLLHRRPLLRSIFNVSQWIVACGLAGVAYTGVAGSLGLALEYPQPMDDALLLAPFAVFVLAFFSINYLAVAGALSLDAGKSLRVVLGQILGSAGGNLVYGILVSPIAFVVAVLYLQFEFRPLGISIALLPLIFVRMSYLTNLKLQASNRDLLKALVKAIETRDPYTSGHSLRVSALARRIAGKMGLSHRKVDEIETAALLHDIGKIDAIYTEILSKPDSLSSEERAVIESHVTKGVELLESISSFSDDVIGAVRHHHEREDGNGYPDRLSGDEIPLGAKIIKVCDAVDAMLSDRPYRDALSLPQVREQLITFAGTQFDVGVVAVTIRDQILESHKTEVAASKEWSPLNVLGQSAIGLEERQNDLSASVRSVLSSISHHKELSKARPPDPGQ